MSLVEDRVVRRDARSIEPRRPEGPVLAEHAGSHPTVAETSKLASALTGLATSSFEVAVDAMRRGAHDIEVLSVRCDQLRSELSEAEDRHRQCLESIRGEVLRWQGIVDELVEHHRHKDQQLRDAVLQRASSDERAVGETRRAQAAEQRSAAFERLVVAIHDQILAAIVKDRCDHPIDPNTDPLT